MSEIREEEINEEMEEEEKMNNQITEEIELKTELFKVKGNLKHNVTSDYTLAHLNKDEREFIIENYENAEFAKSILERFGSKGQRYIWNQSKLDWERDEDGVIIKKNILQVEKDYINKLADRTFSFFMVRPDMITILGRNKNDNFMVKLLGKKDDVDELQQPVGMMTQESLFDKLKNKMSGEEVYDETV